jgi:prophage regulatory protein
MNEKTLLSFPEVAAITGRSRTSLYYDIKAGRFPRPIKIGLRATRWFEADIEGWLAQRRADRDSVEGN